MRLRHETASDSQIYGNCIGFYAIFSDNIVLFHTACGDERKPYLADGRRECLDHRVALVDLPSA